MSGVLLLVSAAVAAGSHVAVAAHRAASAADLAALAGAQALGHGADGCAAASATADRNRARLTGCQQDGLTLTVTVSVDTPRFAGLAWTTAATARAGPGS